MTENARDDAVIKSLRRSADTSAWGKWEREREGRRIERVKYVGKPWQDDGRREWLRSAGGELVTALLGCKNRSVYGKFLRPKGSPELCLLGWTCRSVEGNDQRWRVTEGGCRWVMIDGMPPGWLTPSLRGREARLRFSPVAGQLRYMVVLECSFRRTLKGQTVSPK